VRVDPQRLDVDMMKTYGLPRPFTFNAYHKKAEENSQSGWGLDRVMEPGEPSLRTDQREN
jgi:hypothetical protein